MGKRKAGKFAWLLAVLVGLVIYQSFSPNPLNFGVALLSGTPNPIDAAHSVVVEHFYGDSCTVSFHSIYGTETKTFTPCKFTYHPSVTDSFLAINSVYRGRIEVRPRFHAIWKGENSYHNTIYMVGFGFHDDLSDSLSWTLWSVKDGKNIRVAPTSRQDNHPVLGLRSLGSCNGVMIDPIWGISRCYMEAHTYTQWISGKEVVRNRIDTEGTRVVDSSNTFTLTALPLGSREGQRYPRSVRGGSDVEFRPYSITFEVINNNFYLQEDHHRNNIPTTPHYRRVDCPILKNYTIVTEEFTAGREIRIDSFRAPVNYFCQRMPVLVLDTNRKIIETNSQYLQDILSGKTVVVPSGNIFRIDYVIRANRQLGLICDPVNLTKNYDGTCPSLGIPINTTHCEVQPVFDATTEGCTTTAGIIHFCNEGKWNDAAMACVVQPKNECPVGTVKRVTNGVTECIHFLPVVEWCTTGDLYDVDKGKCCYGFEQEPVCPSTPIIYSPNQRVGTSTNPQVMISSPITYYRDLDVCGYPAVLDPKCGGDERLKLVG